MKKYILSLAIFAFVFSLLTVSASSARAYECEPGHLFSIFTGQPCRADNSTVSQNNYSNQDLKIGSRGEYVKEFQQLLKDGGFLYGRVDGIFGRITDGAANRYYKKYPCHIGLGVRSMIGYVCPPVNTNAPVIHGVSGPQTLNVNQEGTWTVTASDVVGGGSLSYTVIWGDEVYYSSSASVAQRPALQSATFTHSYTTAGTYNPTFTVTNQYGQSAKTSLSVKVGNVNPPTPIGNITVVSPNGGETWVKGTTQIISWLDSTYVLFGSSYISPNAKSYDVTLQATCAGYICTDVYRPSYTIATNTYGSTYNWSVGRTSDNNTVPDGAYLMKVCHAGTSVCDFSDRYFTISSNVANGASTISYLSPSYGPTGTTVTITGSGFAATGNKIKFGDLGVEKSPSYNLNSSDGTHLTFTVPYSNYFACWDSYPACMIAARMTAPGVYPVSVIINEKTSSNSVDFTVTQ